MLDSFFNFFSYDLGIDLGTSNTLVLVKGKGIAIREPTVVAQQKKTRKILAIGSEAKRMMGKTPGEIRAFRPLAHGVIADFDATRAMLEYWIKKVHENPGLWPKISRPRVIVGIPSGVTEVERRAVWEVCLSAGARTAFLIEEPMAAAIGAGLAVEGPAGMMVVDIGGGTTEIALISLGGIVVGKSLRVAGVEMDQAIVNYLRLKEGILIGEATAEEIKIGIGSAYEAKKGEQAEKAAVVRGRDLENGLPRSLKVTESEVREALGPVVGQIIEAIHELTEEIPPELVADILERGIILCGGASQLKGLDKLIAETLKIPVWLADDAQTCVVRGCGKLLEDESLLQKVKVTGGLR